MNIEALRKRCLARFTVIPEIAYALTRHWFIISFCLCIGTGMMLAKVSTDPVIYCGRSTLALNAVDNLLADADRGGNRNEDAGRFFTTRLEMFQSDSVLRKVVLKLKVPNIFGQEQNNDAVEYGPLRRAIQSVKERVDEFMAYLEHPTPLDQTADLDVQRAIKSFRKRTRIDSNPKTGTVLLLVFGNNRDRIAEELDTWFEAARQRIIELGGEAKEPFVEGREKYWQKKEQEAKEALDAFKKASPDVSRAARDILLQQIQQYDTHRVVLLVEKDSPSVQLPETTDPSKTSPQVSSLKASLLQLENQLLQDQTIYGEDSDRVKNARDMIRRTNERLRDLNVDTTPSDPKARKAKVEDDLRKLDSAIVELRSRHLAMDARLDQLEELESELKDVRKRRQGYEDMILRENEIREARRMSQLTIVERATVDYQPFDTYPLRQVLFGAIGGLVVGVTIALLLELLTNKVRFRHDIYTEFGVPVIGVIPRK